MNTIFNHYYLDFASNKILEYSPRISMSIFVLILALLISIFLRKIIIGIANKKNLTGQKLDIVKLISSISGTTIIIIGIISSLGTLGLNVSALLTGLGLSGFAVGFAMKDALSNLLSGILIILYQPFKTGDRIRITGFEGDVVEINLRYTILRSEENSHLIPNSNIFNSIVTIQHKKKV